MGRKTIDRPGEVSWIILLMSLSRVEGGEGRINNTRRVVNITTIIPQLVSSLPLKLGYQNISKCYLKVFIVFTSSHTG